MRNRWSIAAAAVGIHVSIGSVYAWSVWSRPLTEQLGWPLPQVQFTFSLAIVFLGLSAALLGQLVERVGPRRTAMLAAAFFGAGLLVAGWAVMGRSLYGLYLGYGVLGGIGLGVGYVAPVSTLVKWFPDRRGLATGLAIMGFGFAALVAGPVAQQLMTRLGLASTFFALGTVYSVVIFAAAQYLAPPPPGWAPAGGRGGTASAGQTSVDPGPLAAHQAVLTRRFACLWTMLFINVTSGVAVISVAATLVQERAGLSASQAAAMVGIMGLFNGGGRLAWASASDRLGRANTYTLFFALQVPLFLLLGHVTHRLLLPLLILLVMACYGGGFACMPAYIADLFGTRHLGALHGYMLTAWAAAGLAGPLLLAWVRLRCSDPAVTTGVFAGLLSLGGLVSLLVRLDCRHRARERTLAEPTRQTCRTFRADPGELAATLAFVAQGAERAGLDPGQSTRLQLAVEEATTNICRHAHLDELAINQVGCAYQHRASYELRLSEPADGFAVEVVDAGVPFDPLAAVLPATSTPVAERQPEGLGLLLLRGTVDDITYERVGETNHLRLRMRRAR